MTKSTFEQLRSIDVSEYVETYNNFNYLSWAYAIEKMYLFDPDAEFEFLPREIFPDGTMMLYCKVTIKGRAKTGWLPVMNHKNFAIQNPTARQINDSRQRCLVKTIALHGLGLGLYAGEDITKPEESKEEAKPKENKVKKRLREKASDYADKTIVEILKFEDLAELNKYLDSQKTMIDRLKEAYPDIFKILNDYTVKTLNKLGNKEKNNETQ